MIVGLLIIQQTIGKHPRFIDTMHWPLSLLIWGLAIGFFVVIGIKIKSVLKGSKTMIELEEEEESTKESEEENVEEEKKDKKDKEKAEERLNIFGYLNGE